MDTNPAVAAAVANTPMIAIDGDVLTEIAPANSGARGEAQTAIIGAIGGILRATLARFEINTTLRAAHFLAQICHESDGFCTTVEYATGDAYEGRKDLGNTDPGDGRRYKGRGLIQLTGHANYAEYGQLLGLDLVGQPELAAEPKTALSIACQFWTLHKLNSFADQDDIVTITRRINGGTNGLDSRRAYLSKAKAALARLAAGQVAATAPANALPILRRGSQNDSVAELQRELRQHGFAVAIDGDFGPGTEVAVMHLQASKGLDANGIVGPQTWDALRS